MGWRVIFLAWHKAQQGCVYLNSSHGTNPSQLFLFRQELNNCIIYKTDLTSLIVGGDWNCTLSKRQTGGAPWRPTIYSNLVSTTMEMFDLVDVQRVRHSKLRKSTYESKSLKVKSEIDFFLVAKNSVHSVLKARRFIRKRS